MNILRVIVAAVGFFGAIFFSPWVPFLSLVLLSLRFRAWEALALGVWVDFLWFTPSAQAGLFGFLPLFTLASLLLVWGLEPLRNELLL